MKTFYRVSAALFFAFIMFVLASCWQRPEACFTADKTSSHVNEEIHFNAACSNDTENYEWDFGDSTRATVMSVKHKYTAPGTYTVTLIANQKSKSSATTQTVTIVP